MAEEGFRRNLTAILSASIEGYSRYPLGIYLPRNEVILEIKPYGKSA